MTVRYEPSHTIELQYPFDELITRTFHKIQNACFQISN